MRCRNRLLLFVLCVWPGVCGAADWEVGLARVPITPQTPVRLSGYASRTEPFKQVVAELHAKAMTFRDADGNSAILITTDLLGLSAAIAQPVLSEISRQTGIPTSAILINSSHTHTGPGLRLETEGSDWPADQTAASVAYTKWLQTALIKVAVQSTKTMQPAVLARGQGVATFVMNRREFTDRGVRLGVNPRGLADRSVPVLRVQTSEGRILAVLFGTACHNTTLGPRDNHISGDFAGYAQQHVESANPGVVAMFVQGCAGDANPFPRGSEEIALHHGETLGREVLRVLEGKLQPIRGPLTTVSKKVRLPLQPALSDAELKRLADSGSWRRWVADEMRSRRETGTLTREFETSVSVWQFGNDLTMVSLPGEVVVGYVRLIEQAVGPRNLWINAYCNDVFGYLPTADVLREGGYETRGLYSGGVGFFSADAERVVVDHVKELARQVGRDPEKHR